jgi:hypothetical protein
MAMNDQTPPGFRNPVDAVWANAPTIVARQPSRGWCIVCWVALALCVAIAGAAIYFGFRGAPL